MKGWALHLAVVVWAACSVAAQAPRAETQPAHLALQSANPLSAEVRQAADRVANTLLKIAERMPGDQYGFQAVPDIPTFAAEVGHAIDVRMRTCADITGSGHQLNASRLSAKSDLLAAMKSSIAECDEAFWGLTDASIVQMATGERGGPRSRLSRLYDMVAHDSEECGYLSLHLRLRGIEPPSSVSGPMR